jgi:hypothetical protein
VREGIVEGQETKVGLEEGGESGAADHVGDGSGHDHCRGAQCLGNPSRPSKVEPDV